MTPKELLTFSAKIRAKSTKDLFGIKLKVKSFIEKLGLESC
jgi:hypothetical protein